MGSLAVGLTLSAIRWLLLDNLHHYTGIEQPNFDFSQLQANLEAFNLAVEHYYRYYQHYGNMLFAILTTALCCRWNYAGWSWQQDAGVLLLESILFLASRDSLRRYYERTQRLLGTTSPQS
jgi:hypothetical protein